jgi:hypothetical protein
MQRVLSKALAGPTARWRDLGRKRVRKAKIVGLPLPAMTQGAADSSRRATQLQACGASGRA